MMNSKSPQPYEGSTLPWKTVTEMLRQNLSAHHGSEAVIDGDTRLSYQQLGAEVKTLSAALSAVKIEQGDNVVIWSHNCWQWIVCTLACWNVGAVIIPVSARLKPLEITPILLASKAKLLISSINCNGVDLPSSLINFLQSQKRPLSEALPELQTIATYEDSDIHSSIPLIHWNELRRLGEADRAATDQASNVAIAPEDLCEIIFTSGSTGKPKGVMLAHQQTLQIMWDAKNAWTIGPDDRSLIIAPLSHVTGLNAGLLAGLMAGATLVLIDIFQPLRALQLIEAERITSLAGPPALFKQLLVESGHRGISLSHLRKISILGAPVPADLVQQIMSQTKIEHVFTGYGMTECSSIATTRHNDATDVIATTVGEPMPGLAIKIKSEKGEDLPPFSSGEIWVKGYGVMQGYYGDPEQTRQTITDEGWLKTGDIGQLTPEGRIQLLGRKKEMYISHGFNVFPADIEFLLLQSQQLESVAVVAQANKFTGEHGVAFVVPRSGLEITAQDVLGWAKKNMANYKVPGKVLICQQLPLNANGKIDKISLKNQL